MSVSGKVSSRSALSNITPDVWFAIITQASNGLNQDFKLNIETLREYMAVTGKSAYDLAVELGYDGDQYSWLKSLEGRSAYQIAVDQGQFKGTEQAWVRALQALYTVNESVDGMVLIARSGGAAWEGLDKRLLGLGRVDNTSDLEKPISDAVAKALGLKLDVEAVGDHINDALNRMGFVVDADGVIVLDEGVIQTSV